MKKYTAHILIIVALAGFSTALISANTRSNVSAQTNCITFTVPDTGTITFCPLVNSTSTPAPTDTALPSPTETSTTVNTPTDVPTLTATVAVPTGTQAAIVPPYQSAPECFEHSNDTFHTLWDASKGCHYDHEHGSNPFEDEVSNVFPGFDLFALLGNVQIGHTNPSSPMENTHKHGGFKWDVALNIPLEIFEGAQWPVKDAVIEYHAFGDSSIELEARIHSTVALVTACNPANPTDCGSIYTVQHQDYGQRVSQYQGDVLPYPDTPLPAYGAGFGPYWTIDRYGTCIGCRPSLQFVLDRRLNANQIVTSKRTGNGARPDGSTLFTLLFRVRDSYQLLEWSSVQGGHPFSFGWVCGGTNYNPANCRYTNTTTRVHEVAGVVPAAWDNLAGFDTDPRVGRITAEGFTSRFGVLNLSCTAASAECFPVKLVNMFVGKYGGALPGAKVSNPNAVSNPSRNIWFCNGVQCAETAPGAVPSGWIGSEN